MAENVTYELFQMVKEDNAKTAKLRAENAALQKECEEQNASRCELIQKNAKLRADNERLRATFQKCQIALLFCDDYFDETPAIVQDALSAMDDQQ